MYLYLVFFFLSMYHLFVFLSIYLSVYLSIYLLSIYLSIYIFVNALHIYNMYMVCRKRFSGNKLSAMAAMGAFAG
jgi:hypothetical protein